ncbi:MAG: ribonuclease P protein component [Verrucomicrobiae bacterium]|nr:ribonuclease P protein component [Verrucomicrobiae bacterium]
MAAASGGITRVVQGERLPGFLRIGRSSTIREIITKGRKHVGRHLILYCLPPLPQDSESRAAFLSPRRIGPATRRNRVRRWLREIYRRHRAELDSSIQIVLMGRASSASNTSYQDLQEDFLRLCGKARLISPRDP